MKSNAILAACLTLTMMASGCATTAGAGKDIQSVGKAITKTSKDVQK